ncbi:hypothetical protein BU26DRAFT_611655 [Trematosphaeria pertusa]|uniref:Uncharacterized protein n=1 Tax=Trematosphaeria pertusa TaxID=390896 RepID=A0A6A6HR75_9PLEO|nr:uncharacterized protein BU26DRAFT_611655 [Trematosphaeria pertusa]KAF2240369.1 hypothetical protein BU26DRAFT_611655 [Trematosphaeria pertusa]
MAKSTTPKAGNSQPQQLRVPASPRNLDTDGNCAALKRDYDLLKQDYQNLKHQLASATLEKERLEESGNTLAYCLKATLFHLSIVQGFVATALKPENSQLSELTNVTLELNSRTGYYAAVARQARRYVFNGIACAACVFQRKKLDFGPFKESFLSQSDCEDIFREYRRGNSNFVPSDEIAEQLEEFNRIIEDDGVGAKPATEHDEGIKTEPETEEDERVQTEPATEKDDRVKTEEPATDSASLASSFCVEDEEEDGQEPRTQGHSSDEISRTDDSSDASTLEMSSENEIPLQENHVGQKRKQSTDEDDFSATDTEEAHRAKKRRKKLELSSQESGDGLDEEVDPGGKGPGFVIPDDDWRAMEKAVLLEW